VFAASSSVFDSYGFEGSPGVVQKVQVFFPVSASSATTPPRTSYSMPAQPVNTFPSPTFGASVIPVWSASHTSVSHTGFPHAASTATPPERLPHRFPRCRVDRHHPAVAGSDVHLAVPHGDTAILAAFIRVAPRAVDPDVGIELPAQLSCRSVNGEHFVERSAEIDHPVDDNWFR